MTEHISLRDVAEFLWQEVNDRSTFKSDDHIPDHDCGYIHRPDTGYCEFHDKWVRSAERLGFLDEWLKKDMAKGEGE